MCSVIGIRRGTASLLAGSYDFYYAHGLVLTNCSGLNKTALGEGENLLQWEARYGSVTFNQFGRELPSCGMNEVGLAIHMAELAGNHPLPAPEGRPRLTELQWIQYQLDRYASVDEVIDHMDDVAIEKTFANLHYALSDRHGKTAVVEFIDGKSHAYRDIHPSGLVVTNHAVGDAIEYIKREGHKPIRGSNQNSLVRFSKLWDRLRQRLEASKAPQEGVSAEVFDKDPDLLFLADSLSAVFRSFNVWKIIKWIFLRIPPAYSCWNTIFDTDSGKIYFRAARQPMWRSIDMRQINFSPIKGAYCLDIEAASEIADVTGNLRPVQRQDNARIIGISYKPLGGRISQADLEELIDYPNHFSIAQSGGPK